MKNINDTETDIARKEASRARFVVIMGKYNSDNSLFREEAIEAAFNELSGFIGSIAKKYYPSYMNEYYQDMYNSGVLGLMKGLEKYDPTLSMPTTYFESFILHEIAEFINKGVRGMTSYYANNVKKINTVVNKFKQEGKDYTINDIAIETGLNVESVKQALSMQENTNHMYYETESFLESEMTSVVASPEEEFMKKEMCDRLMNAIEKFLTKEEKEIVLRTFGFMPCGRQSNKVVSDTLGIPVTNIRRIKANALRKLQSVKSLNNFRDYNDVKRTNLLSESIPLISQSCDILIKQLSDDSEDLNF